jgi:hypothetical protein
MDAATSLGTAELRTDIAFVVVGESELTIVVLWLLDNVVVVEYVLVIVFWLLGNDDVVVVAMTACAAASPAPPEYEMKLVAKSASPVNRGRLLRGWRYSGRNAARENRYWPNDRLSQFVVAEGEPVQILKSPSTQSWLPSSPKAHARLEQGARCSTVLQVLPTSPEVLSLPL